jgi:hypothetical protein
LELNRLEQLSDRNAAHKLMQHLKPYADALIAESATLNRNAGTVPTPLPIQANAVPFRSFDHVPILNLEQMDTETGLESHSSCVSFIDGTLLEDGGNVQTQLLP